MRSGPITWRGGGILEWLKNPKFLKRYITAWSYLFICIFNFFKFVFRMRWERNVARMGEWRGVYRVLIGKHEGNRPLGKPRRR
jgi:hypothetical protein